MVTSVRSISTASSSTAFGKKEKLVRLRLPLNAAEQTETRLQLTQSLQSTLDLRKVLELFLQHIQDMLEVSGLEYKNPSQDADITIGKRAIHHCDYRLITQQDNLGEVIFSRGQRFTEAELETIETILGVLIFPLRNALQYREALQTAMRDPLTGTGNRAALDNALRRELQMAVRHDQELSLLVIDIDHFKLVNDTYGHASGDDVLRKVAQSIETVTRQTDMTFRFGGEEFIVVLSKTEETGAKTIAERIRQHIDKTKIRCRNGEVHITVSIGTSTLQKSENVKELFDRADQALYQAKQTGRNRVFCDIDIKEPETALA